MPWTAIHIEEYGEMYRKEEPNLSVYASGTCMEGGYIGGRYFPEDYISTEWGFKNKYLPYIKSLKENGKWQYWKWEGPAPEEED